MNNYFKKAINEFNAKLFHEAHDTLEEFWSNYQGADRRYYQAWIQLCVALHLSLEGRAVGAKKVLERARKNLEGYQNEISFFDLAKLFLETESYLESNSSIPRIDLYSSEQ